MIVSSFSLQNPATLAVYAFWPVGIGQWIGELAIVDGDADYEAFIKTMNAVIAKYAVKHHKHNNANANATQPEAATDGV